MAQCSAARDMKAHFLLRSDYEAVRGNGVLIKEAGGDFTVRPHAARAPAEIGVADLVLIGLKTTANSQFKKLLPPLVNSRTAILTLQNGLGNEEQLARLFPAGQIEGGLCFVCLNRIAPGVIHHLSEGMILLGEYQRPPEPRTHQIARMFGEAGVQCKVVDNLARAHWEKLVWNIPFNGLGVASVAGYEALASGLPSINPRKESGCCLTTDQLLADHRWKDLVLELMLEVIAAAKGQGFEIPQSFAQKMIDRTLTMGAYKASTLIDFECGLPLELESLFLEPLRHAQRTNVATPQLAALCRVLQELETVRKADQI